MQRAVIALAAPLVTAEGSGAWKYVMQRELFQCLYAHMHVYIHTCQILQEFLKKLAL